MDDPGERKMTMGPEWEAENNNKKKKKNQDNTTPFSRPL